MPSYIPTAGRSSSGVQADDVLYLDPLFDRLEAIERRLDLAAQNPPPVVTVPEPDFSPVYLQLQALRQELPDLVSATVRAQLATAEACLPLPQPHPQPEALDAVIRESVSAAVAGRFEALEHALKDHAASITTLHERVNQTDSNLQRLVAVISRLIEGPGMQPVATGPDTTRAHAAASFEAHLSDALKTQAMNNPEDQALDNPPRRPRAPLSRII
jgi:hypothetical protein